MVSDGTWVAILSSFVVETPLSMVLFPPRIVSNTSWTRAISNEPRRVTENFTKKLKKKGR
jgi:hypothetical protein